MNLGDGVSGEDNCPWYQAIAGITSFISFGLGATNFITWKELRNATNNNEKCQKQLSNITKVIKELEEKNKELKKNNEELKDINNRLVKENDELNKDNKHLKKENARISNENDWYRAQNEKLKEELIKYMEEIRALKEHNEILSEENEKLKNKTQELEKETNKCKSELNVCNNKTSNLTLENKMLFRKAKAQRLVSNENRLSKYAFIEFVNKTNEELDNNKQSQLGWVKYNILSSLTNTQIDLDLVYKSTINTSEELQEIYSNTVPELLLVEEKETGLKFGDYKSKEKHKDFIFSLSNLKKCNKDPKKSKYVGIENLWVPNELSERMSEVNNDCLMKVDSSNNMISVNSFELYNVIINHI